MHNDIPYMYKDNPYMYEDNPYMYDDIAYMYDDIAYINDDMTYMYEYHIHVWYQVIGCVSIFVGSAGGEITGQNSNFRLDNPLDVRWRAPIAGLKLTHRPNTFP